MTKRITVDAARIKRTIDISRHWGFAFEQVGLEWKSCLKFNDRHLQPTETGSLLGDPLGEARVLNRRPPAMLRELVGVKVESNMCFLQEVSTPS